MIVSYNAKKVHIYTLCMYYAHIMKLSIYYITCTCNQNFNIRYDKYEI